MAERHDVRLAGEVYDLPLHHQPVLAEYAGPSLPVAEDICARHVCLPVHSDMTDDEVDQVLRPRPGRRRRPAGTGSGMRVAVTGGCGFIGSHVVDLCCGPVTTCW